MLGKNFLFHITGRQLVIFNPVENYVQAFGIETSGFQFGDKNEMLLFRLFEKSTLTTDSIDFAITAAGRNAMKKT